MVTWPGAGDKMRAHRLGFRWEMNGRGGRGHGQVLHTKREHADSRSGQMKGGCVATWLGAVDKMRARRLGFGWEVRGRGGQLDWTSRATMDAPGSGEEPGWWMGPDGTEWDVARGDERTGSGEEPGPGWDPARDDERPGLC